jgi:hypothetical protein
MRKLAIAVMTVLAAFASVLLGSGAVQASNAPATITHLDLSGVSCASATFCAAVGERDETGSPSNVLPLAEIWNGARWRRTAVSIPKGWSQGDLDSVSCTSPAYCVAVGTYGGNGISYAMAQTWNGRAWTVTVLPQLPHSHVLADSVSCGAPRHCATSMASRPMPPGNRVFVDVLSGTTWHVHAMSLPKDVELALPSAISCASATYCVLTGEYYRQDGAGAAFATWNGQRLAPMTASAYPAYFWSLSCPSTTHCAAAGELFGGLTDWGYVGVRNGGTWIAARVAQPRAIVVTDLIGVSCAAPNRCLAVGYLRDRQPVNGTYPDRATAVFYNGKTWTRLNVPFPAGSRDTAFQSVSCLSVTRCVAVGLVAPGSHVFSNHSAFTGFWNGTSWRTVPAS